MSESSNNLLKGLGLPTSEQVDFYTNEWMKPAYHSYMGMGYYWVICHSLAKANQYCLMVLGGSDPYVRNSNRDGHMTMKSEDVKWMTLDECVLHLHAEQEKWYQAY
jgi:hypothetical protein